MALYIPKICRREKRSQTNLDAQPDSRKCIMLFEKILLQFFVQIFLTTLLTKLVLYQFQSLHFMNCTYEYCRNIFFEKLKNLFYIIVRSQAHCSCLLIDESQFRNEIDSWIFDTFLRWLFVDYLSIKFWNCVPELID